MQSQVPYKRQKRRRRVAPAETKATGRKRKRLEWSSYKPGNAVGFPSLMPPECGPDPTWLPDF